MNSENSVNAESLSAEVEQPVGPGMGCIAVLSFCIGGAFVGAVVGEWIRKMSQAGGPDEGGSMGVILPSSEAMGGAVLGGLVGLLVYTIVLSILNATDAQRKRVWRAILVVTLPIGLITVQDVPKISISHTDKIIGKRHRLFSELWRRLSSCESVCKIIQSS